MPPEDDTTRRRIISVIEETVNVIDIDGNGMLAKIIGLLLSTNLISF